VAIPDLDSYEYQYEDDGVRLNSADAGYAAALPFIDVDKISGLDSPEFRTAERDHEGVDGGYVDAEFYTTRTIVIEGILYADPSDPDTVCDQLRYNYRPVREALPFYFRHPNKNTRLIFGKPLGCRYDVDRLRAQGRTPIIITLACPDPYIYDAELQQQTFGRIVYQGSGHGFNHGFNLSFGGDVGDPGGLEVFNAGNHDAYPVITIFGPVDSPVVSESSSGRHIGFDIELALGEFLVVDTRRKRVMLNGVVSRRSTVTPGSRFPYVKPGSSSFFFSGNSSEATPSATAVISPPTFVQSASTLNSTASTSVVVTKPTGTVNGMVMIALIAKDNQNAITPPSGWTLIGTVNASGGNLQYAAYYRVASSEGANYTWSWTGSVRNSGWIGTYDDVETSPDPIDTSASDGTAAAGTLFNTPIVNTSLTGSWLITGIAERHATTGSATNWTQDPESADVERLDHGSNGAGTDISHAVYDSNISLTAGSYNRNLTASQTASQIAMWTIAIAPTQALSVDYLVATDGDAADIVVGSTAYLVTASGALREPTLFTITGKASAFGFTNVEISPSAASPIVAGDKLVTNIPYFGVDMRSTYY
jgi:Phage tail protein